MNICCRNIVKVNTCQSGDYKKLKQRINITTLSYGATVTTGYFITQGAEQGVSSTVGVITSLVYMGLLDKHVDNIENGSFQKQLLAPVGAAVFETMWNHAPFAFDFDYGATLMGFLAYKFALLTVLYDVVRDMLIPEE